MPTFILSFNNEIGSGSGRSIDNIDIGTIIHELKSNNLIEDGGGHLMAVGLKLKKNQLVNIKNNLDQYKKIIPCGIKDKGITNLVKIKKKDYSNLGDLLIERFISNLKN